MPRSLWSGDIEMGLLHIPVKLYKGEEDDEVSFHLYHQKCGSAVTRPSVCTVCDEPVEWSEIVKGIDTTEGVVTFTDEEIRSIKPESTKVLKMMATGSMPDPVYLDAFYWIEPEPRAAHAYNVLTAALKATKQVLLGTMVLRTRERRCAIWIREGQLVLSTMRWGANVRAMPEIISDTVSKAEIATAKILLEVLQGELPEVDSYQEAIVAAAEEKSKGILITAGPAKPVEKREVVNLMDAMKQAIEAAKAEKPKKAGKKSA